MRGDGRIYTREGSRFFWVAYYHNGKQKREPALYCGGKKNGMRIEALEQNRNAAEKFLKHRIDEMTAERYGGPAFIGPERKRITVAQLLDALESDCKLRGVQSAQWASHIKQVREHFGDWRAVDLATEHVDSYIRQRLEEGARPATVNRNTQLLAQAYKLAIERKQLPTGPLIRHLSESGNARQGFFSETQFRALFSNLPSDVADFALFGYLTGWRKGEIRSLRWADVDGDTVRLLAENSKNGESRIITLDGELAELIERRKKARTVKNKTDTFLADLVFHRDGQPVLDFRKAWALACKLAGVQGKLFHDLRRTAVRNMIRAGVPERVAMQVSGHRTRSMLDRYNIVNERDLREAMQRTQTYLIATAAEEAKRKPAEIGRVQ
jgi:integrase